MSFTYLVWGFELERFRYHQFLDRFSHLHLLQLYSFFHFKQLLILNLDLMAYLFMVVVSKVFKDIQYH